MDFRSLPSVDSLMSKDTLSEFSEQVRSSVSRQAIAWARERIKAKTDVSESQISDMALALARQLVETTLKPAVNLSGVVLHTGLGRARLHPEAVAALQAGTLGHTIVELDLESGKRGSRYEHVEEALCELTGAEAAMVVNNCASAVLVSLMALAQGREVILSRGQMVEIGGSFRMPEIVRGSGCRLVEVGCTNKTHLSDYEEAITEESAVILRCHPSNFKVVGFHEEPSAKEISELCRANSLLLVDDVGSGCLIDTTRVGLPKTRTLNEALADGADIVTASGDKLLGGPQAGLILGTKDAIAQVKKHPFTRACRVDKLTLAALEATLALYRDGREMEVPVWCYLSRKMDEVQQMAEMLASAIPDSEVVDGTTEIGGGSLPGEEVPTKRVKVNIDHPDQFLGKLRSLSPPAIGYIEDGCVMLDPRTAEQVEIEALAEQLASQK